MKSNSLVKKLPLKTQLGYGVGSIGEGLAFNVFYLYFIWFLTDFAGIHPAMAGTISLIAVLWDAITDPLIGHLSDQSRNAKGKRRPFIAKFSIPLGIMVFLIFTNWSFLDGGIKVAYFIAANMLFWLFFTATDIPYITLGGEIAENPNDRISIRSFCTIFYYVGFIVSSSGTIMLLKYYSNVTGGDYGKAWSWIGITFGILTIVAYYLSIFTTKGMEPTNQNIIKVSSEPKINIFKSILESLKIKPYRNLVLYFFFFNLGALFITSAIVYITQFYIGFNENELGIYFLVLSLLIIVLSPIVSKIAQAMGNRKSMIIAIFSFAMSLVLFKFIPLNNTTIYIQAIGISIGCIGYFVMGYAMVFEVGHVSHLKTGFKNDGVLLAFFQFAYKFATAIAMWLVGIALTVYQYNPDASVQSDYTMSGLLNMATIIPGALCLLGLPFLFSYSLTPENIKKLTSIVKAKEEGIEIDMDTVNELL